MNYKVVITFLLLAQTGFGQVKNNTIFSKEYSKEISLYKAKKFVIEEILDSSTSPVKFEIDPLAAASSGELTSLVYQSSSKHKEGLLLGFYGSYWNESGVVFQGFSFKNLPKEKALQLLNNVEKNISEYRKYLNADIDNNNVYFDFDDMTFLICAGAYDIKIRVFWGNFDADCDMTAFKRTKKRLEKKLD